MRCEDYPCCGHNMSDDPCDGNPSYTATEYAEAFWCDFCGFPHDGYCED